ncbi:zinc metallo proteinase [Rhexocercosporidium sp. MPI-PUGE-AT-0058]|nr:zinc metallo proteinase [Rhexocercosporidium sp. MPI-PUGE-AT-0058]
MAPVSTPHVSLDNITDGETIYQRALIIIGKCLDSGSTEDFLVITSTDPAQVTSFPTQNWPISEGRFKALVILSPGENILIFHHQHNGLQLASTTLKLTYVPLLQTPPLHLAIMVAKDSPLLIDCPPHKRGAVSTAHSDIDAAINKFRMTAYMWQAQTAEDMRAKGLGRRSFRLEEEWMAETLSRDFLHTSRGFSADHMRSTAKCHIIRSEMTVEQIRDAQVAQQNPSAYRKDDLHKYFETALKKHGGPFQSSADPIVAGLILDSTFSPEQDIILGHAALGCSKLKGLSLGMFGSHLTYSWPRFIEELSHCLLDTAVPGDTVGNDNGECGTMWEACSIGQGAFLHEVGHAFGAPHTTGIMARGYAQDWPKNFLSRTAYCAARNGIGATVIDGETLNNACWDIEDALSFKTLPQFRLPSDPILSPEVMMANPTAQVILDNTPQESSVLVISSIAQIARVEFNGIAEHFPTVASPRRELRFTAEELETRFARSNSLKLSVLGMNGRSLKIANTWRLFSNVSYIKVPGSNIVLQKKSVMSLNTEAALESYGQSDKWEWSVLLQEKGLNNALWTATEIDSRVGCCLDGAIVYYEDGHKTPCGPRTDKYGRKHSFGGHASEKFPIPKNEEITKVEVGVQSYELNGLRFHMSGGSRGGYLYESTPVQTLEPVSGHRIIGFYGWSKWGHGFSAIMEFGIITAPRDVDLPTIIYDMPELRNTDGGNAPVKDMGRCGDDGSGDEMDEDSDSDSTEY